MPDPCPSPHCPNCQVHKHAPCAHVQHNAAYLLVKLCTRMRVKHSAQVQKEEAVVHHSVYGGLRTSRALDIVQNSLRTSG